MDVPGTKGTGQLLLGYWQAFGKELESIQLDLSVVSQARLEGSCITHCYESLVR